MTDLTQTAPTQIALTPDSHDAVGHHDGHETTDKAAERSLEARILITVLIALVGWGLSIWTWGVPGLYIPALAMVPVCYVLLILISRG